VVACWRVAPTAFAYWPSGSDRPEFGKDTAVLVKTHGVATISWSPAADAAR
jgi:protein-L-isoaspartate(D-aspartate) O-methyltransferase